MWLKVAVSLQITQVAVGNCSLLLKEVAEFLISTDIFISVDFCFPCFRFCIIQHCFLKAWKIELYAFNKHLLEKKKKTEVEKEKAVLV